MAEYIKREAALQIIDYAKQLINEQIVRDSGAYELLSDTGKACYDGIITALAMCKRLINEAVIAADVQPLSIVAEHIKNRLYETAFNTDDEKASRVIEDMANRIDFWIDELKDGDTNG